MLVIFRPQRVGRWEERTPKRVAAPKLCDQRKEQHCCGLRMALLSRSCRVSCRLPIMKSSAGALDLFQYAGCLGSPDEGFGVSCQPDAYDPLLSSCGVK